MGCSRKAVFSVSFLWFLLVVSLSDWNNNNNNRRDIIIPITSTRNTKFLKPIANENISKSVLDQNKFKLNYVSKRRVPNGPDPIHNRRIGNSKLPPT
ncbi:hypothetical protein DH2020_009384 [Rehmannia glutinosa]|uniref:CLAVATA3/ESR (CLE)-related protein n=1 Tax=Rehmannia glutinosa TaxID=99300 RepID=A0ABR0X666_REHGL